MIVLLVGLCGAVVVLLWMSPPATAWTPATDRDDALPWRIRGGAPARRRARPETVSTGALVPEALELLALALLGGGALSEAARTVSVVLPGRSGEGLSAVAAALRQGQDTEQAWSAAGAAWEPARRSVELASVAGIAPGPALRQTAADLRAASVTDVEVGTARLGVRMVLPLGLAFLPAFVLMTVLPLVLALTRDLVW